MSSKSKVSKRNQSCSEFAVLGKLNTTVDSRRTSSVASKLQRSPSEIESSVGLSSSYSFLSETQSYSGQLITVKLLVQIYDFA